MHTCLRKRTHPQSAHHCNTVLRYMNNPIGPAVPNHRPIHIYSRCRALYSRRIKIMWPPKLTSTSSAAIAERPRFGRNISGKRYSAPNIVDAGKLKTFIFYTINPIIYEKQSLCVLSPLWRV